MGSWRCLFLDLGMQGRQINRIGYGFYKCHITFIPFNSVTIQELLQIYLLKGTFTCSSKFRSIVKETHFYREIYWNFHHVQYTLMSENPTSEQWKAAHLTALCLGFPTLPTWTKEPNLLLFHVILGSPGNKCFKITGFANDVSGHPAVTQCCSLLFPVSVLSL